MPPIEINQGNELIDGWHRVRAAERAGRTEIAYIVVETADDDDLSDWMWAANLKHGVQYSRAQRQTQGLRLHGRGLKAKEIAERVGVSASSVYSWTKALREQEKLERDAEIARLREEGKTQQESLMRWVLTIRQSRLKLWKFPELEKSNKSLKARLSQR